MPAHIQIKGIRDGLLITLPDGQWDDARNALMKQIDEQGEFLRGGRLALDVGNQALNVVELSGLRDLVSDKGIALWAVLSHSPKTIQTAQSLGLATRLSKPAPEREPRAPDTRLHDGESAVFVKKTLRSGYQIEFPGHVIVVGDVNPGAEIVAGGDVVVWGRLRGMVHAGADGNEKASVCALDLSPTQLRIAGQIALAPQRRGKPQPEIAYLEDGRVVAESWNQKERK